MPEWIIDLFARYGYAVVFVGVFLENAGVPVPGETALLAGAALSHFGRLTRPRVVLFDDFFARHGAKTVFIARFVTGLRVFGAVLAGASGLRWRTFLFYNAAGAVVWSTAVAIVGYALGHSWETLERLIGRAGLVALVIVGGLVTIAVVRSRRHNL